MRIADSPRAHLAETMRLIESGKHRSPFQLLFMVRSFLEADSPAEAERCRALIPDGGCHPSTAMTEIAAYYLVHERKAEFQRVYAQLRLSDNLDDKLEQSCRMLASLARCAVTNDQPDLAETIFHDVVADLARVSVNPDLHWLPGFGEIAQARHELSDFQEARHTAQLGLAALKKHRPATNDFAAISFRNQLLLIGAIEEAEEVTNYISSENSDRKAATIACVEGMLGRRTAALRRLARVKDAAMRDAAILEIILLSSRAHQFGIAVAFVPDLRKDSRGFATATLAHDYARSGDIIGAQKWAGDREINLIERADPIPLNAGDFPLLVGRCGNTPEFNSFSFKRSILDDRGVPRVESHPVWRRIRYRTAYARSVGRVFGSEKMVEGQRFEFWSNHFESSLELKTFFTLGVAEGLHHSEFVQAQHEPEPFLFDRGAMMNR